MSLIKELGGKGSTCSVCGAFNGYGRRSEHWMALKLNFALPWDSVWLGVRGERALLVHPGQQHVYSPGRQRHLAQHGPSFGARLRWRSSPEGPPDLGLLCMLDQACLPCCCLSSLLFVLHLCGRLWLVLNVLSVQFLCVWHRQPVVPAWRRSRAQPSWLLLLQQDRSFSLAVPPDFADSRNFEPPEEPGLFQCF